MSTATTTTKPKDRFERQSELIPADVLAKTPCTVIGVGAVGRNVALQLAAIGVPKLQLFDFDVVDNTNITTQGYLADDVGESKVVAMKQAVHNIDRTCCVVPVNDRFRPRYENYQAVFCCVDSISARSSIWKTQKHRAWFWSDARMLGEVIRVLTVSGGAGGHPDFDRYGDTLFAQSEAQTGTCTSRSTIYAATMAAAMMVHQFTRWLRGIPTDFDTSLNLLAGEMVVE